METFSILLILSKQFGGCYIIFSCTHDQTLISLKFFEKNKNIYPKYREEKNIIKEGALTYDECLVS